MKGCVSLYHDSVSKLTKTDQLGMITINVYLFVPLPLTSMTKLLIEKLGWFFNLKCNNFNNLLNPTIYIVTKNNLVSKKWNYSPTIIDIKREKRLVWIFLAFHNIDNEVIIVGRGTFYKLIHICWYKKASININCLFKSFFIKPK